MAKPIRPPKQKPQAPLSKAEVDGIIAGMPQDLDAAIKALEDMERRCAASVESNRLEGSKLIAISGLSSRLRVRIHELREAWAMIDGYIRPPKADPDLF